MEAAIGLHRKKEEKWQLKLVYEIDAALNVATGKTLSASEARANGKNVAELKPVVGELILVLIATGEMQPAILLAKNEADRMVAASQLPGARLAARLCSRFEPSLPAGEC